MLRPEVRNPRLEAGLARARLGLSRINQNPEAARLAREAAIENLMARLTPPSPNEAIYKAIAEGPHPRDTIKPTSST